MTALSKRRRTEHPGRIRDADEPDRAGRDTDDGHVPTRDVVYYDDAGRPIGELTTWLRAQVATGDVRAAQSVEHVLDYYEQKCREAATNPAVEMQCRLIWSVIQRLALPYADRSGYRDEWRPRSGRTCHGRTCVLVSRTGGSAFSVPPRTSPMPR